MSDSPAALTLEEKIDEILRYQKSQRRWTAAKTVSNIVFFVVLVGLPLLGMVYFFNWAKSSLGLDLGDTRQMVEGLKTLGGTEDRLDRSIENLLEQLN